MTTLLSEHSSHLNPLETACVPRGGDNRHSPVHLILFLNYIHIVELFLLPGMRKHIPGKDTPLKETQLVDCNSQGRRTRYSHYSIDRTTFCPRYPVNQQNTLIWDLNFQNVRLSHHSHTSKLYFRWLTVPH